MTRENERIPEDIKETALAVVNRGYDEGLVDAVAAALLAERNAQRERDAKIADYGVRWTPELDGKTKRFVDESCCRVAAAIRRSTLTQELADQAKEMDMGDGK